MNDKGIQLDSMLYVPDDVVEQISRYRVDKDDLYISFPNEDIKILFISNCSCDIVIFFFDFKKNNIFSISESYSFIGAIGNKSIGSHSFIIDIILNFIILFPPKHGYYLFHISIKIIFSSSCN